MGGKANESMYRGGLCAKKIDGAMAWIHAMTLCTFFFHPGVRMLLSGMDPCQKAGGFHSVKALMGGGGALFFFRVYLHFFI